MSEPLAITPQVIAKAIQDLLDENVALRREIEGMRFQYTNNNRKKLGGREVQIIREMSRTGFSQKEIAESFDLNPATVSRIIRGQYHP